MDEEIEVTRVEAYRTLSPQERSAFERKCRGQTRREIAIALGVSQNRAKNLLQYARRKLSENLPDELKRRYSAVLHGQTARCQPVRMASLSDCINV